MGGCLGPVASSKKLPRRDFEWIGSYHGLRRVSPTMSEMTSWGFVGRVCMAMSRRKIMRRGPWGERSLESLETARFRGEDLWGAWQRLCEQMDHFIWKTQLCFVRKKFHLSSMK